MNVNSVSGNVTYCNNTAVFSVCFLSLKKAIGKGLTTQSYVSLL